MFTRLDPCSHPTSLGFPPLLLYSLFSAEPPAWALKTPVRSCHSAVHNISMASLNSGGKQLKYLDWPRMSYGSRPLTSHCPPRSLCLCPTGLSACYSLSTPRSSHFQFFILPRDRRCPRYLHLPSLHSGCCSNVTSSERRLIHTSIRVPALSLLCFTSLPGPLWILNSLFFLPFTSLQTCWECQNFWSYKTMSSVFRELGLTTRISLFLWRKACCLVSFFFFFFI